LKESVYIAGSFSYAKREESRMKFLNRGPPAWGKAVLASKFIRKD